MNERENCRRAADAECQRQYRRRRKNWGMTKLTKRVANIAEEAHDWSVRGSICRAWRQIRGFRAECSGAEIPDARFWTHRARECQLSRVIRLRASGS